MAKPLSNLVANPLTASFSTLLGMYWNILLGKGAGTGWALDSEVNAAKKTIHCAAPVIFDVGANIGEWSALIHQIYPNARIFLFEPQVACHQYIRGKNIPGYTLIPKVMSSSAGHSISFFSSEEKDKIASVYQRRDSYFDNRVFTAAEVPTETIDNIIQEYKITSIDFMKMDVEGHELDVLKGANKSLEEKIIKALSFEFGSGNINSRTYFHDFWDLLTPIGYSIYRILPSSRLLLMKEYYEDCEYFRGVTNYVATLNRND
jgi:FkbM family methyltransferase